MSPDDPVLSFLIFVRTCVPKGFLGTVFGVNF